MGGYTALNPTELNPVVYSLHRPRTEGSWIPVQPTAKDEMIEREALMLLSTQTREGEA